MTCAIVNGIAARYLLRHAITKVVRVVAVLRDQLWAYPAMIALLGAFIAYQLSADSPTES